MRGQAAKHGPPTLTDAQMKVQRKIVEALNKYRAVRKEMPEDDDD